MGGSALVITTVQAKLHRKCVPHASQLCLYHDMPLSGSESPLPVQQPVVATSGIS